MKANSDHFDAMMKALTKAIDQHVLEERKQIFLGAQRSPLDPRGRAVPLYKREANDGRRREAGQECQGKSMKALVFKRLRPED